MRSSPAEAPSERRTSRRRFLARATSIAVPCLVPASLLGRGAAAPSERLSVGVIGVGGRGMNHVDAFSGRGDTRVAAVCDPYLSKRRAAREHAERRQGDAAGSILETPDFREILARPDIDAVAIASPESWHAIQAARAAISGKDVYCERAMSLTVAEGRVVVGAVRRHGRVFQVGLQQRSDRNFRFACELARNGYLGELRAVEVAVPGGRSLPVATPAPVPADLDYELWLGPAPWTPYNDLKCTYNWYFIRDYCVGWIQSWGIHHIDIALWGAPSLAAGRLSIEGTATFPTAGLADTSIGWSVEARSRSSPLLRFTDEGRMTHGCRFVGETGWVHVDRGGIRAEPESLLRTTLRASDERLEVSGDHHGDFVDAIRTRRDPVAPVECGHRATTLTIVADIATRLGRKLSWDWEAERFVDDAEANRLLRRTLRAPWTI